VDRVQIQLCRLNSRELLQRALESADAVIVSDYGYGNIARLCSTECAGARTKENSIVIDSRFRMASSCVTAITPNSPSLRPR